MIGLKLCYQDSQSIANHRFYAPRTYIPFFCYTTDTEVQDCVNQQDKSHNLVNLQNLCSLRFDFRLGHISPLPIPRSIRVLAALAKLFKIGPPDANSSIIGACCQLRSGVSDRYGRTLKRLHTCPSAAQSTPVTSQVCPFSTTAARSPSDLVFPMSYVYALPFGPPDASQRPHTLIASFEWKDILLFVFGRVRGGFSGKHDCNV